MTNWFMRKQNWKGNLTDGEKSDKLLKEKAINDDNKRSRKGRSEEVRSAAYGAYLSNLSHLHLCQSLYISQKI
jgi:hypothetical protein